MRTLLALAILVFFSLPAAAAPCVPLKFVDGCTKEDGSVFHGKPGPLAPGGKLSIPTPSEVLERIKSAATPDLQYALALAIQTNTPQSQVRSACYQAILDLINNTKSQVTDKDGKVLAKPDPAVISTFEQAVEHLEEANQVLNPGSPVMVKCNTAASIAGQDALAFINAAVTGAVIAPKIIPGVPAIIP